MNNSTNNTETLKLDGLLNRRQQQNLTVQAVADGMKVSKDFVHYIESGEFEKLGAPTFVRGHITNYCKVLGIEPSSVLAQIPGHVLQHQQLKTSDAMGSSPLSHVRRQSNHFGRYAVGTALLGMLCMSFYFIWDKWSLPNSNQANRNITISQDDTDSNGEKKITYSSLIPQVSGPNFNSDQSANNLLNGDLSLETSLPGEQTAEEASGTDNEGITAEEEEADLEPNLSSDVGSSSATGNDSTAFTIVMQFEEQAWVSIKTLDGDFIVQDLMGPGLREIQVTEPVHFRIGNAQKMQLTINNNSVELAPLTNRDVADFQWPLEPNS